MDYRGVQGRLTTPRHYTSRNTANPPAASVFTTTLWAVDLNHLADAPRDKFARDGTVPRVHRKLQRSSLEPGARNLNFVTAARHPATELPSSIRSRTAHVFVGDFTHLDGCSCHDRARGVGNSSCDSAIPLNGPAILFDIESILPESRWPKASQGAPRCTPPYVSVSNLLSARTAHDIVRSCPDTSDAFQRSSFPGINKIGVTPGSHLDLCEHLVRSFPLGVLVVWPRLRLSSMRFTCSRKRP